MLSQPPLSDQEPTAIPILYNILSHPLSSEGIISNHKNNSDKSRMCINPHKIIEEQ